MKENVAVSLGTYIGIAPDKDVVDVNEYAQTTRACYKKLQEVWCDLELSDIAQKQQLEDITERALGVWNGAVDHAEQHRLGIRARIDEASSEIRKIAEQLGEHSAIEESRSSMGSLMSAEKTIKRQFDEVMGELEDWKRKRENRIVEHDNVQLQINAIRERLGMATAPAKKPKNSITRANMDFLKLELERMRGEKVRKERKMEATLGKLRKLCIELGADDADVAASVHHSLRGYHKSLPGHYYSYSSYKGESDGDAAQVQIDLGDATFAGLDSKLEELHAVKEEREARLQEMTEVLHNMWDMLEVPPADEGREFFEKLLRAPSRLHDSSIDKCGEEITRLEAEQAKAMRGMIQTKAQQMTQLCESTCLPAPNLSVLLDAMDASPGQVADALSKLVKMIAEVMLIVEKREPVLKLISDVEEGFKEARWHFQHQQENLFNNRGRDANRLLQRAIKAEEKKKKLPKVIAHLRSVFDEWEMVQGSQFVLGHTRYRDEVLAVIEQELSHMNTTKPKKAEPKSKAPGGKPPRDTKKEALPESEALKLIAAARDIRRPSDRPQTAPAFSHQRTLSAGMMSSAASVTSDSAPGHDMLAAATPMRSARPATALNPLQDLVNNLANASAISRNTSASNRYAPPAALSSLQLDDQPNMDSAAPSPALSKMQLPSLSGEKSLGALVSPHTHSPSASLHSMSRRSVHSEALSHLSMNAANVTMRKGKGKEAGKSEISSKPTSAKRSPVPEHSVMHTGMMS